jgi:hypothetical protein
VRNRPSAKPKPVETDSPALVQSLHVVHRNDRIPANSRRVMTLERDRLLPAQDIDRIVLLQIAEQREILDQNPMRRRVPARIDDEDVKARCSGRFVRLASRRLPGLGPRLDDVAFLRRGRHLRRRCQRRYSRRSRWRRAGCRRWRRGLAPGVNAAPQ